MIDRISLVLAVTALCELGCSHVPSYQQRFTLADNLAAQQGWHYKQFITQSFPISGWMPQSIEKTDELTVYIEGDGLAWISSDFPSSNPTPTNPLALQLALKQPHGNVAYLSRPCQFYDISMVDNCGSPYWTAKRFAPEVVSAMNEAIDQLKTQFAAKSLILVGYSGGGAVAALVTARRNDVLALVTVAGNLDIDEWVRQQRISKLEGSLNPADASTRLSTVPQIHLLGDSDKTIPKSVLEAYVAHFQKPENLQIKIISGYDHHCCWVENWPEIWMSLQSAFQFSFTH